jgi:hypothetical protein
MIRSDQQNILGDLREFRYLTLENRPPADDQRALVVPVEPTRPAARENGRIWHPGPILRDTLARRHQWHHHA